MATIDTFPNELIEPAAALAIKAGVTVENGLSLSLAISQKRIADMMEEDRKPQLRLMEEGEITESERRRRLLEGLDRDGETLQRIADALWGTEDTTGILQLLNPLNIRNHY